jgi:hypothetical protein
MMLGTGLLGSRSALLGAAPLSGTPVPPPAPYVSGGGYPITQPPSRRGDSSALLNRDYRPKEAPQRITRVHATATAHGVVAEASVGVLRARGTIIRPPVVVPVIYTQDATAKLSGVMAEATMGRTKRVSAIARAVGRGPMTIEEAFLLGFAAGQEDDAD